MSVKSVTPNVQSVKEKKLTNSKTNYHREIKLVPINMDCCFLHLVALKFVLRVRLHRRSVPKIYFFNVKPKFDKEIVKLTALIA